MRCQASIRATSSGSVPRSTSATRASSDAYLQIAQAHPDRTGTCYGQIGAGLFFMQQHALAIEFYEAAKQYGADARRMDDNIVEA